MSVKRNTSNTGKDFFESTHAGKIQIDSKKFRSSHDIYFTGLNNYILFQKFSNFKWPAWVLSSADKGQDSPTFIPLMLINSSMRDCLYFTNLLSEQGLSIDPAGMLTPSYGHWSIEIWIYSDQKIYRPAEDLKNVIQRRDIANSIIHTSWGTGLFTLTQTVYGARSTIDEAVIEAECSVKTAKRSMLLFVVRPYDRFRIGGLDSVEYLSNSSCINIRDRKSICSVSKPDVIFSGGGESGGDLNIKEKDRVRSESPFGLATLGLGFELKKGENRLMFRVSLDPRSGLPTGNFDFRKVKDDYASFAGIRIRNGANFRHPSPLMENWLYGTKISLLNCSFKNLEKEDGGIDFRTAYFVIHGTNRMGYSKESVGYIDHITKERAFNEKNLSVEEAADASYLLSSIADSFIHTRDLDFLRSRFEKIKKLALLIYGYAKRLKKSTVNGRNSLRNYFIEEDHPYDCILIAHALGQYSYLARCLGIFGDETKFKKESDRLAGILLETAFHAEEESSHNEFIMYNAFAGFPFRIEAIPESALRALIKRIEQYITEKPILITSIGWDSFLSLIVADNLILIKDMRGFEIVAKLLDMRDKKFVLPEYMHPSTARGNWGEGASMALSSMVYSTIRNLLFIDHPERLDLFPLPRPEWFEPGKEISIEDAPSRFGLLSIRVVSTTNEIQFHFDKLPKFVPHDIMINLPVKARIKQGDDFILKKEDDRSYVINGWPTILRFIRK